MLLSQVLFSYNNSLQSSIGFSPFFANFGYHLQWVEEIESALAMDIPGAQRVVSSFLEVHCLCLVNLAEANQRSAKLYNVRCLPTPMFEIGDQVLLNLKNFRTLWPLKKLDIRSAGPYNVLDKISLHAYRLDLPAASRVHNVFHVALLRPFKAASYPGQQSTSAGPIFIDNEGKPVYEVANVLNSQHNASDTWWSG